MDSIVDAFFPILRDIEKEVLLVEDFVSILDSNKQEQDDHMPYDEPAPTPAQIVISSDSTRVSEPSPTDEENEKENEKPKAVSIASKSMKKSPSFLHLVELWYHIPDIWRKRQKEKDKSTLSRDLNRLRRMTSTRRLVNTLGRLLSSKSEVIGQIRKRLDRHGEVAIYLGDVQDHIISLHQSLAHYERMLSHSHPAYLAHLRFSLSTAKGGTDQLLVLLGIVGILVLCSQSVVQLGGMNVHVPYSEDYKYFGIFLGIAMLVSIASLGLVRHWFVKVHGGVGRIEEL